MLGGIIGLFSLVAIIGLFLISYILSNKNTPKGLALVHGIFGACAIILLVIYCFISSPAPVESLVLFILAALGGFVMMYRDIIGKSLPKWLAILHGSIASIGFIFLIIYAIFVQDRK